MALTDGGKLIRFTPGAAQSSNILTVTGLAAGEQLIGIDFRPPDGALIGVTKNGTAGGVVEIDPATGVATRLSRTGGQALLLAGMNYGVDFNPAVPVPAALRIVGDNGENYRLVFSADLNWYSVVADIALTPTPGNVVAAAYTNNFAGSPVTTLYNLDVAMGSLVTQGGVDSVGNPNMGVLAQVGPLGVTFDSRASFDIDGVSGVALAALNVTGAPSSGLYTVNLGTGAASCVGTVPAPTGERAVGLAINTPAPAMAVGLTTAGTLIAFTPNAAGVATVSAPVAITGLAMGDEAASIDYRPRTGVLTLVTRNTSGAGAIYEVNFVPGVSAIATVVPQANAMMTPFTFMATGPGMIGAGFNPVPNALRITTDANENFRLAFPDNMVGYVFNVDTPITPPGGNAQIAYTNKFDGASVTRQYVIDTTAGQLKRQTDSNGGTQINVGAPLGVTLADIQGDMVIIGGAGVHVPDPTMPDVNVANIGNTVTFSSLNVGGSSNLYRVNLATGVATQIGAMPIGGASPVILRGLAVNVRK